MMKNFNKRNKVNLQIQKIPSKNKAMKMKKNKYNIKMFLKTKKILFRNKNESIPMNKKK